VTADEVGTQFRCDGCGDLGESQDLPDVVGPAHAERVVVLIILSSILVVGHLSASRRIDHPLVTTVAVWIDLRAVELGGLALPEDNLVGAKADALGQVLHDGCMVVSRLVHDALEEISGKVSEALLLCPLLGHCACLCKHGEVCGAEERHGGVDGRR